MKITKGLNPVVRAAGVISAVAIVTGGVTFAALSSSVTLSNTTLSTADANLQIYSFTNAAFGTEAEGFNLGNLVPGQYSDEQKFYLKNNGDTALNITARVLSDENLTATGLGNNESLTLRFTSDKAGCVDNTSEATLGELIAGEVELPCNPLSVGAAGNSGVDGTEGNYSVAFKFADGVDADISGLDLRFTGTVTSAPQNVTLPDSDESEES